MTRLTINDLRGGLLASPDELERVADRGRRRYRVWGFDFDTRAALLTEEISKNWDEDVKELWRQNRRQIREGLCEQFGTLSLDQKIQNFIDLGTKPFSILAHHNSMFEQIRSAFTVGAFFPALTGACALGERILNHLVLDLREDFRQTPQYKRVYRKSSFDDWNLAVETLRAWDVLLPDVATEFIALAKLRHRSIHFNASTSANLRENALTAVTRLRLIIERQFGTFGLQSWFIEGVNGATFIKREYEERPFVRRYFLPRCPCVGVEHAIEFDDRRQAQFIDFHDYGDGDLSDEEFRKAFNSRELASLAHR